MTLARSWSVALVGLDGHVVEVEADLAQGIPGMAITGLPDASLNEARDRLKSAVVNSQVAWPQKRITLGLSPAALPKRGQPLRPRPRRGAARRRRRGAVCSPQRAAPAR